MPKGTGTPTYAYGGSEFQADFEEACQQRGIRLFVLPPHSPKLNGHVERAHRTHTEEFYEVAGLSWSVAEVNQQALAWERVYNTVRSWLWDTGQLAAWYARRWWGGRSLFPRQPLRLLL